MSRPPKYDWRGAVLPAAAWARQRGAGALRSIGLDPRTTMPRLRSDAGPSLQHSRDPKNSINGVAA